jgi:protein-S-isoprenylcysteine O-methyltransferase Ste14
MFWLILSVTVWGIIHSLMASLRFKDFFRRILGNGRMKFFRLFYNIVSVISILPVLYLAITLPDKDFYQAPAPWSYIMLAGQGISMFLLLVVGMQTDVLSFLGLRQLFEVEQSEELLTTGFYGMVRHPLYTFILLSLWLSSSVSINFFVVYLGFTIYILVGIYFEERKLLRQFGQAYEDYRSVTPTLIPRLKFNGNK